MDDESWVPAFLKPSGEQPSTIASDPPDQCRYQADIQKAKAMREEMDREKARKQQLQDPSALTESDVQLGLAGLQEAEHLANHGGKDEEASRIYEMSLEILIRFLRSDPSILPFISRDTVYASVQAALTEAETLKLRIRHQQQLAAKATTVIGSSSNLSISASSSSTNNVVLSLSSALRNAMLQISPTSSAAAAVSASKGKKSSATPQSTAVTPATSTATNVATKRVTRSTTAKAKATAAVKTVSTQSSGQPTASRPKTKKSFSSSSVINSSNSSAYTKQRHQSRSNRQLTKQGNQPTSNRQVTKQPTYPPPPTKKAEPVKNTAPSKFLNSKDPMVQTIKSDLYVDPSQLQDTTWDDIAGLADAKQSLQEAAILPMMRPDLFTGLRKPRNILLYGPPGTGKTLLVRAVAKESQCLLFICTASALTSKWHGEGEKLVRTLFEVARAAAPSIVFVDEMDALLSTRKSDGEHEASRRFKTEFMTQLDGIVKGGSTGNDEGKHVLVIACTNCPWDIDSAVLRRFPRRIYIPLPDPDTRKVLIKKLLKKAGTYKLSRPEINEVVKRTDGFSGSDMTSIASEAAFGPLRDLGGMMAIRDVNVRDIRPIALKDFEAAIKQSTKSVSPLLLKQYDEWKQQQAAS